MRASGPRCGGFSQWGIGNCLSLLREEWDLGSVRMVGYLEAILKLVLVGSLGKIVEGWRVIQELKRQR